MSSVAAGREKQPPTGLHAAGNGTNIEAALEKSAQDSQLSTQTWFRAGLAARSNVRVAPGR